MRIQNLSDDIEVPGINISPDIFVGRMEQVRVLVADLNKDFITEEQKNLLLRAIDLLFHSCFLEMAETKMEINSKVH